MTGKKVVGVNLSLLYCFVWMNALILYIGVFSHVSFASFSLDSVESNTQFISNETRTLVRKNGNLEFKLNHIINHNNEKEVFVELLEQRDYLPDSKRVILVGRDITGDGFYDLWFSPTADKGELFKIFRKKAKRENGWDIISQYIADSKENYNNQSIVKVSFQFVLGISLTVNMVETTVQRVTRLMMDLHDLEYRIDDDVKINKNYKKAYEEYQLVSVGWNKVRAEIRSASFRKYIIYQAIDIGFVYVAGAVAKGVGRIFTWGGGKIAGSAAFISVSKYVELFLAPYLELTEFVGFRISQKTAAFLARHPTVNKMYQLKSNPTVIYLTRTEMLQLSTKDLMTLVRMRISITVVQKNVKNTLLSGLQKTFIMGQSGVGQWRYISTSFGLQLLAEGLSRGKEVFDPNPIILAGNLLSNKEVVQNLSFMTSETFLMTSVTTGLKVSTPKKMAVCAFIALANSTAMNIFVKGEADEGRVALDTGWEMIVGNSQVQIDLAAIRFFENKAQTLGSGRLRFLGYAVAVIDQFTGYSLYSLTTQSYEEHIKQFPPGNELVHPEINIDNVQVVFQPVYADDLY